MLDDINSHDNFTQLNVLPSTNVYHATKPARQGKPNVMPNSNSSVNPLPLKISSVASGDGVAFMTNGLSATSETDSTKKTDSNIQPQISGVQSLTIISNVKPNELTKSDKSEQSIRSSVNDISNATMQNLNSKVESIDITETERHKCMNINREFNLASRKQSNKGNDFPTKGYIYCSTNIQLGKVKIECTSPNRIKLYLNDTVDVNCHEKDEWQTNLSTIAMYMHSYIRNHFYAVYPAFLKLEWTYIKTDDDEDNAKTLCDLNSLEQFSVR